MFGRNLFVALLIIHGVFAIDTRHAWGFQCIDGKCVRARITETSRDSILSLHVCRLYCADDIGTLWPIPSGNVEFSMSSLPLNPHSITFASEKLDDNEYFRAAVDRFRSMQLKKIPRIADGGGGVDLSVLVNVESDDTTLDYNTDEGYRLSLVDENQTHQLSATISAKNFFGARHAIETLSQLIVYDELNNRLVILSSATIEDKPQFKHRGISLDTSRTFFTTDVIKRTINGLAMAKLNTFHWHIVDSQSFPLELESHPDLTKFGAYSSRKIYTKADIRGIVEFARARGVRVIPEFDSPAHVGAGWQSKKKKDLVACLDYKPYLDFCWQPPCGHLDPTKEQLYDVLEDVYGEMVEIFEPAAFHMGGDEIFFSCWNSSESLRQWMVERGWELNSEGFMQLWGHFQTKAQERLDRVSEKKLPIILWTSELTEDPHAGRYLDKDRYIVQVWTTGNDTRIKRLLENDYRLVISNYDALYLDCGYGSWASDGFIWCGDYHWWQKIYQNDLDEMGGERVDQILGAEATVWTETIDEHTIDAKIWPRASALAERLWSNPSEHWRRAEPRLLMHVEYLKTVGGLATEPLQMDWCVQNEGLCKI